MRRNRGKLLVAVLALLLSGLAAWLLLPTSQRAPAPASAQAQTWPAGRVLEVAFEWRGSQATQLIPERPLEAAVDLAGRLRLTGLGQREGAWQVHVDVVELTRHRFEVLGQDLLADPQPVLDGEGLALYEPDGALRELRVAGEPRSVFARVCEALLKSAQSRSVDEGLESTVLGQGRVRYRGGALERSRERLGYTQLDALPDKSAQGLELEVDGRAWIALHPDGYLQRLDEREQVTARRQARVLLDSERSFRWQVERVLAQEEGGLARLNAGVAAARVVVAAAAAPRDEAAQRALVRRHLEQQRGGMDGALLLDDLRGFARGALPDDTGWMVRAAAVLMLQPELSQQVAALAMERGVSHEARGFALDLLSQTGHAEAQAALRELLRADELRADARYGLLLQRLTFVRSPTPETLAMAEALYADADPLVSGAAVHSLGALAGSLAAHRESAQSWRGAAAQRVLATLQQDLASAADPARRAILVSAVGNTRMAAQIEPVMLAESRSQHRAVRRAAASGLRSVLSDAARARLIELLGDVAAEVQRASLGSLMQRELSTADQGRIAAMIEADQIPRVNDQDLVTLLSRSAQGSFQTRALQALLERNPDNARLRARIRKIMSRG